jgi:hypothetical protein
MRTVAPLIQDSYYVLSVALALVVGLGAVAFVIVISRENVSFFRRGYWMWIVIALALCVATPLLKYWGTSLRISVTDAYLLQGGPYMWGTILVCYCMLLGFLLGGLVALLTRARE